MEVSVAIRISVSAGRIRRRLRKKCGGDILWRGWNSRAGRVWETGHRRHDSGGRVCKTGEIPYLGICLGMQMAIVAFARFVVGYHDAGSIEFQPETMHPVIALMPDQRCGNIGGNSEAWGDIRVYWMKIPGALPFMERGRSPRDTDTAMRSITITGASWKKQGCTWRGCPRIRGSWK